MTAIPDDDALVHPDVIEVASRGAEVICLALCEWPGLVIKGSGAASSLRAWLAALLARNGPFGAEVLMVDPLGGGLFPGIELPGLRRIETVEAALLRLERAILDRGQRLDDAGVHDVASHRRQAPEYPLPLLLCVTDVIPARLGLRWLAMCAAAEKMGLGALVLASEPDEERELDHVAHLEIGEDGLAASVGPAGLAGLLEGSRPFQLSAEDAVDLLAPVALIHNDHEFDEPDVGEDGDVRTVDAVERCRTGPSLHEVHDGDFVCWPDPATHEVASAPILVEVFGPAVVEAWGEKITSGLRANAYELLAWYVLHPDGATAEAAIDALWPDASPKRGRERFWTALGNLRTRLSGPGEEKVQILAKVGDHYGPDSSMLDVDLWRFEAALREATQTNEVTKMVAALERACSTYGGEFYPSGDALWVEPVREDLHRRALDAHIRLAELHADEGRPEAAISTLERTIEIDSICEEAYRRLIVLQTALGHTDAAQRTWQLLQRELADLDLEPESATVNLIGDVLSPRRSMVRDLAPVQGRST
jgi:DNA-binding SARP family transcriptional activator